ncbi:hypothetical protein CKO17_03145 [Marichromatium gracile]|nr:hypothetical protein [Marichromatium gracile]
MKSGIPAQVDSVKFLGHQGRKSVTAVRAEGVPDLLIKVPGSVGCLINLDGAAPSLERLLPSHQAFCLRAIRHTRIKPRMCRAHSTGAIAYLAELLGLTIPDPSYISAPFEGQGDSRESSALSEAMSSSEVQAGHPARVSMLTTRYLRDPAVVRAARERANGVCEHCGKPAPFVSRETGQPFLEVHHLTPLAEKGEDVLDNVKALCPNCHRQLHHG